MRDDQAAVSERVPRCLPSNTGNKVRRAVQVCGGTLHTSRTDNGGGARAGSPVTVAHREPLHMFPHRSRPSRTYSRNAAACRAAAGIQGDGGCVHSLPRTHRRAVHMFPRRSGGQRRQCRGRKCSRPCGWSCGGRCGAECRRNWRQRVRRPGVATDKPGMGQGCCPVERVETASSNLR